MYYVYKTILVIVLIVSLLYNFLTTILGGVDQIREGYKLNYIIFKATSFVIIAICAGFLMNDAKKYTKESESEGK